MVKLIQKEHPMPYDEEIPEYEDAVDYDTKDFEDEFISDDDELYQGEDE